MSDWDARSVVEAKRDGRRLTDEEMRHFVLAFSSGEIPDYLASAFLMAAFLRGLDEGETLSLLRAMVDSGETLPLSSVRRPKVDKHSTGGVADSVTLVFAPLAASLGLAVAKLSGRGLGHTGGTLDKLESIPGFRTDLAPERFEDQVEELGCAVAAQTADLVPADGALYALRDATGTVPSIPLIATSVMSKKLAIGSDLIVLDVKAGSGAFMKTVEEASDLARTCVSLGAAWGRPVRAAVTDMSQPLGDSIGNALDVAEAISILRGEDDGRLREAAVLFVGEAVSCLSGLSFEEGAHRAEAALSDGSALETFRRLVEAQGGDPAVVDDPVAVLPRAPVVTPIVAPRSGILVSVEAEDLGRASADLGAGRHRKGDPVDPAVGLIVRPKIGDRLERGEPIGEVHARSGPAAEEASLRVLSALTLGDGPVDRVPLVHTWFGR